MLIINKIAAPKSSGKGIIDLHELSSNKRNKLRRNEFFVQDSSLADGGGASNSRKTGNSQSLPELKSSLEMSQNPDVRKNVVRELEQFGKDALAILIEALRDPDPSVSGIAIDVIGKIGTIGTSKATFPLEEIALTNTDPTLRQKAVYVLGKLKAKKVLSSLLSVLEHDDDPLVRMNAAIALKEIKSADSVPVLLQVLRSDNSELVRMNVVLALKEIKSADSVSGLVGALNDSSNKVRRRVIDALGEIRVEETIPVLLELLRSPDLNVQEAASRALSKFEEKALPRLRELLRSDDSDIQGIAIMTIGYMGKNATPAVADLRQIMSSTDIYTADVNRHYAAVWALTKISPEEVPYLVKRQKEKKDKEEQEQSLIRSLKHSDRSIKESAIAKLNTLGVRAKGIVPELIVLTNDPSSDVRQCAVEVLGASGYGSENVICALIKKLKDNSRSVQESAVKALINFKSKVNIPALVELLKSNPEQYTAIAVIEVLKEIGEGAKEAVPVLIETLEASEYSVKAAAAKALGEMGEEGKLAIPSLVKLLEAFEYSVKAAAVEALGKMGEEGKLAIPSLAKLLRVPGSTIKETVAEALGKMGEEGKAELIKRLQEPDFTEKDRYVIEALGKLGQEAREVIPLLLEQLKKSRGIFLKISLTKALAQIGKGNKEIIPVFIQRMNDKGFFFRQCIVKGLGDIGVKTKEVISALIEKLSDSNPDVRKSAVESLEKLGEEAKEAIPGLVKKLSDSNSEVRQAALKALVEINKKSKDILPLLIEILEGESNDLKPFAAETLGDMGKDAEEAIPALFKILHNNPDYIHDATAIAAVNALNKISKKTEKVVPHILERLNYRVVLESDSECKVLFEMLLNAGGESVNEALPTVLQRFNLAECLRERILALSPDAIKKIKLTDEPLLQLRDQINSGGRLEQILLQHYFFPQEINIKELSAEDVFILVRAAGERSRSPETKVHILQILYNISPERFLMGYEKFARQALINKMIDHLQEKGKDANTDFAILIDAIEERWPYVEIENIN